MRDTPTQLSLLDDRKFLDARKVAEHGLALFKATCARLAHEGAFENTPQWIVDCFASAILDGQLQEQDARAERVSA